MNVQGRRVRSAVRAVLAKLPPAGVLGIGFFIGLGVLVGAAWMFGVLAEDVADGDAITRFDVVLGQWLVGQGSPWSIRAAITVSRIHDTLPIVVYVGAVGIYLTVRRQFSSLRWLLIAVPGGMAVNFLVKLAFQRARPDFGNVLESVATYSFPSGHTAAATLFYGWLALHVTRNMGCRARMLAFVTAAALTVVVAFSRMLLGVHFLTDVLAAILGSAAWLAFVWMGMRWTSATGPPTAGTR